MSVDLSTLDQRATRWLGRRQALLVQRYDETGLVDKAREEVKDLKGVISVLQFMAQEMNKEKEEQTAALCTLALRETFEDLELTLLTEQSPYRGHAGVKFKFKDEKTGVEGDPMGSFGGGPASVLGIVLQVISIVRQPGMARVLILDEPAAQVSVEYQEAVGKLLRKICEPPPRGLGFKMFVVTHMDSIARAAHRRYRAVRDPQTLDPLQLVEESIGE